MNLVIILGLISYSYGYNRRKEQSRRRAREDSLRLVAHDGLGAILNDDEQLERNVRREMEESERIMEDLSRDIKGIASGMADMAVQEVITLQRWVTIQVSMRKGFNLIIDAYRRFIKLQRATCDFLEAFANDIINKYESELNAINQLTPPTLATGGIDISSPRFGMFRDRFNDLLQYINFNGGAFRTALDCPNDLSRSIFATRAAVTTPITRAIYVPVAPTVAVQPPQTVLVQQQPNVIVQQQPTVVRSIDQSAAIYCGQTSDYNGCQSCPYSIIDQSQQLFNQACQSVCAIP